ncbi:hypothetical protein Tcan_17726 [Toxocara canis]|uniref:Uncharacterized protein n=1 Tax=Toxocara canis TaxID=6265 RepID=A0A0B2VWR7_TOXCA|nr:hypothetical protein Tcan_17726 [Toxocara canis]
MTRNVRPYLCRCSQQRSSAQPPTNYHDFPNIFIVHRLLAWYHIPKIALPNFLTLDQNSTTFCSYPYVQITLSNIPNLRQSILGKKAECRKKVVEKGKGMDGEERALLP